MPPQNSPGILGSIGGFYRDVLKPAARSLFVPPSDAYLKAHPADMGMMALGMMGDEPPITLRDEPTTTINASGESEASGEAISRGRSEASQGVKRVAVDSRSGNERPLITGADNTPNPYEHIIRRTPSGEFIESSGDKARPYMPKRPHF